MSISSETKPLELTESSTMSSTPTSVNNRISSPTSEVHSINNGSETKTVISWADFSDDSDDEFLIDRKSSSGGSNMSSPMSQSNTVKTTGRLDSKCGVETLFSPKSYTRNRDQSSYESRTSPTPYNSPFTSNKGDNKKHDKDFDGFILVDRQKHERYDKHNRHASQPFQSSQSFQKQYKQKSVLEDITCLTNEELKANILASCFNFVKSMCNNSVDGVVKQVTPCSFQGCRHLHSVSLGFRPIRWTMEKDGENTIYRPPSPSLSNCYLVFDVNGLLIKFDFSKPK